MSSWLNCTTFRLIFGGSQNEAILHDHAILFGESFLQADRSFSALNAFNVAIILFRKLPDWYEPCRAFTSTVPSSSNFEFPGSTLLSCSTIRTSDVEKNP